MKHDTSLKKSSLVIVTMASFLTPFMGSAVNLAIPSIGKELTGGAYLLSWVVSSFLLASAAFLVPFGRLADIIGRKKIFLLGIAGFSLFSLLCCSARSLEALIIFRLLQGIASAMVFSTGMAILTSVFPPGERGKVLGINSATVYTGLSLGPVLGGAMNHYLGWESIFYFNVPIGILIILLTLLKLPGEWVGASGEKFDLTGSILYVLGLVTFIYGLSSIAKSMEAKYILLLSLFVIGIFIWQQKQKENPLLNVALFSKNMTFAFSNLAALINYSATFAVSFLMSLHLQVTMGLNSQVAGLIMLAQPVVMALLSPFAGRLSDRIEPRIVSSWGMGIVTLGLFVLLFITKTTPIWLIVANLMLLGIGFALFASPNSNAVMGSVEKRFYGIASSTLGTMRLTGQAISMAIVTLIIALYVGNMELSPAYSDLLIRSTKTSFIIFTVLSASGIFASLARGNVYNQNQAK
ncbi:MAG: MFS transporter [Firmicutes bacterium]|nr:MFS transporter [Bacillota bacterium]